MEKKTTTHKKTPNIKTMQYVQIQPVVCLTIKGVSSTETMSVSQLVIKHVKCYSSHALICSSLC